MSRIGHLFRVLPAFFAAFLLHACSTPSSYMGIDLSVAPAATEQSELQSLASRAQARNKHAQLELGIRFEEGRGVAKDLDKAKRLYEKAASDDLKYVDVYQTDADGGRLTKLAAGTLGNGLPAAQRRLERLRKGN